MAANVERVRKILHYNALVAWRTKDFWVRAVMCWVIGAVLLVNDEASNFDLRLKIRGEKPASNSIVLVDLNERDWLSLDPESRNVLRPLKEIVTLTDAYFWNPRVWEKLLSHVLKDDPRSVGITFYFGDNIRSSRLDDATRSVFNDPRLIWGADTDASGRLLTPLYSQPRNTNIGVRSMRHDDDGEIRRYLTYSETSPSAPHLGVRLAQVADPQLMKHAPSLEPELINYMGDAASFEIINAKEIVEGHLSPGQLKDKIVIIGSLNGPLEEMQTPLGRMSRSEVIANIADNQLGHKTIYRFPLFVYLLLLALLMTAAIRVLIAYPQSVTLVIFVLAALCWTSLSVWAFDVLYIWLPIFSPLALLTVTCIVFLSYQLALNERRTWRLEQEQRYRSEIEQLKTNFVSMMSHDLKTPIAKIQAICDRLIAAEPENAAKTQDLQSLRRSSVELHRYIQSILQVTKVEATDFRIQKEVTDINENIERVVARLRPLAQEKGIMIVTDLEPMFSIEADKGLIQEVIHNLIENAIKYTPPVPAGAATDRLATGQVRVSSQEKGDNVLVLVEDTGPGIDPEDQKDIWRKFTRGRNRMVNGTEIRGTGLGLYLVKYFVELHGGHVTLESELGRGTRIGFSIPIADSENDSGESQGKTSSSPNAEEI